MAEDKKEIKDFDPEIKRIEKDLEWYTEVRFNVISEMPPVITLESVDEEPPDDAA